jgi:hypothetical protein
MLLVLLLSCRLEAATAKGTAAARDANGTTACCVMRCIVYGSPDSTLLVLLLSCRLEAATAEGHGSSMGCQEHYGMHACAMRCLVQGSPDSTLLVLLLCCRLEAATAKGTAAAGSSMGGPGAVKSSGGTGKPAGGNAAAWDAMNGVAANLLLHLTSSVRFEGTLNTDLNDITMNLVSSLLPCRNWHLFHTLAMVGREPTTGSLSGPPLCCSLLLETCVD